MKKTIFLLLIPFALFASKILSYNVYDRSDRVDVMFTFDTPYEGVISQKTSNSKIIIKLEDATIESQKTKQLTSPYLTQLTITPVSGYTQITAYVPANVNLQASKTSDAYGLRLRFNKTAPALQTSATGSVAALPTKKDLKISSGYYIVIAVLLAGLVFVFYLKRKMANPAKRSPGAPKPARRPWLFSSKNAEQEDVNIRFSKQIDQVNKVIMVDYGNLSYLILAGNDNILLDKFEDNKPVTTNEFEEILKSRNEELTNLLQIKNKEKEPFQTYKEKAASIAYDV
ncbi:hypothetical protein [Sulfurimonas sp. HSL-1716]|uniref:hypothetical protein n=1 Tax=Hydrocurvibacter sulfurireducens TaxID=3131937 RepID=UPI0031F8E94F